MVPDPPISPFAPFLPISAPISTLLSRGLGMGGERSKNESECRKYRRCGRKRRKEEKDRGGERGRGGEGGYARLVLRPPTTDRARPLYWFLAISTFLPYRQGVAPSFGRPRPPVYYLEGGRKNKTIDGEKRDGCTPLPI